MPDGKRGRVECVERNPPENIVIRGARVHNLKRVDLDVPLGRLVGIAGVSGSGKSSLALGVLYAEGSRRYLEALSAYTRRRLSQPSEALVDSIENVPAALALHQRPAIPGVRSTFGTSSELSNSLRLMFSRLGSHCCPNGHRLPPTPDVALDRPLVCPECGAKFGPPSAESFSFNSDGACPRCQGTGVVRVVDEASLVPDETKTINEGAVLPWGSLMWDLMKQVCGEMGVRLNVPFCQLTPKERDIVFHGPAEKKHIIYKAKKTDAFAELDFTYYNAVRTVENALAKVKDEQGLKRVARFLSEGVCPECLGTRLNRQAASSLLCGKTLPEVEAMPLVELADWVAAAPGKMPEVLRPMAESIAGQFARHARRLLDLGLGYLALARGSATLSTGERQRVQLAHAVRNQTTGVLYVLDEPSIGLHPANIDGLMAVVEDLVSHGNSVVLVDHDARILKRADWLVEMGPEAGEKGGNVIASGAPLAVSANGDSRIGPFLAGRPVQARKCIAARTLFARGAVELATGRIHTVRPLSVRIPRGCLTAVTGVSGSGKTTLILESLVPALRAQIAGCALPAHVTSLTAGGINRVNLIDATPIGANVRSTVATYSKVLDDLRRGFAATPKAKAAGLTLKDFSYNTGSLRCPTCDGTGQISMDVQFLPDVTVPCPDCHGSRYGREAGGFCWQDSKTVDGLPYSLPRVMGMTVSQALEVLRGMRGVSARLKTLHDLGLGYLTLGEATPALSGGEAQRLKLAAEMGRIQDDALFVFDEPTIGLHPLDVASLIGVFQKLLDSGATLIVIEHDLDMIANADYVIDLGPGGGEAGGRIVASGTPDEIRACPDSVTGRYL